MEGVHKEENRYTAKEKMIWTLLVKICANAAVIAMFLLHEFDNQYGKGRFMW